MDRFTRQQVEEEIDRARAAHAEANPIPEGGSFPSSETIYPQLNSKDLSRVDLSELDLSNANLSYSDLREANLTGTILVMVELNSTDLRDTSQMEGTDLRGATMSFAKLEGADLGKAILEGDDPPLHENTSPLLLQNAQYDNQTKWPRGFSPEDFGAIRVGR